MIPARGTWNAKLESVPLAFVISIVEPSSVSPWALLPKPTKAGSTSFRLFEKDTRLASEKNIFFYKYFMIIWYICYQFDLFWLSGKKYVRKSYAVNNFRKPSGCQNNACCTGMLWSKVCKRPLSRCTFLPFACLPFCHNIRITVKAGYNHNNQAQ